MGGRIMENKKIESEGEYMSLELSKILDDELIKATLLNCNAFMSLNWRGEDCLIFKISENEYKTIIFSKKIKADLHKCFYEEYKKECEYIISEIRSVIIAIANFNAFKVFGYVGI